MSEQMVSSLTSGVGEYISLCYGAVIASGAIRVGIEVCVETTEGGLRSVVKQHGGGGGGAEVCGEITGGGRGMEVCI